MYYFLNSFSFENHKDNLTYDEIITTLSNLSLLINEFNLNKLELIIHSTLSIEKLNGQELKSYIPKLDKDLRVTLLAKLTKSKPFCSNTYEDYHEDEIIVLANCKEELSQKDVICNFLGCAMFLKAPIITPELFCCNSGFSNDQIKIICDNGHSENLKNYLLSNYKEIFDDYIKNQKENLISWDTYFEYTDRVLKKVKITNECKENFKIYSYDSQQGKCIQNEIERFETFLLERKDKVIPSLNFKELDKNINDESGKKQRIRKSKLTSKDINGNSMVMSWHSRVNDDFRQYFYFDDDLVYFTMYCKKIPDP